MNTGDMNDFVNSLTEEQKQKLFNALNQSNNQNDVEETKQSVGEDFRVYKTESKLGNRRKEPVKARRNEWEDTGEDRHIETKYGDKTPRRREPPRKSNAECHVCGKTFKVDSRYVYGEFYRCNRCGGKK